MTTFQADDITLHKVREHVWEIEQTGNMRVPARVFASETLLEKIAEDKTLQQLKNTTHLPGIQRYAICMPDGHQGYGFPVGGVAGIDAENGCISPGAVGYDINCLSGDTEVLLSFGRRRRLSDLADGFEDERAMVAADGLVPSDIRLLTESEGRTVYEVETEFGDRIEATTDHPFSTPDGMSDLGDLREGDVVHLHPFRGLPDEEPEEFVVLDEDDFAEESEQLRRVLNDRGLLPLKSTDEAFNRLLKLVGFHTGDGSIGAGEQTWFYGRPEDLETIQEDIRAIGFKPSRIYSRERDHEINGKRFSRTEYSVRSTSMAFQRLLVKLGAPEGKKVESSFTTPAYFERLADWQQALYVSAFFGAEMNAPSAQLHKNLHCPKISNSRTPEMADAGEQFLEEIGDFLERIGIGTNSIERFETDTGRIRLRLGIKNDSENLIRFLSTVGYRYSKEKQKQAVKALLYLKYKERTIEQREQIASEAKRMADGGVAIRENKSAFEINERFVERSIWSGRKSRPRPPVDFPGFDEFCEHIEVTDELAVETTIQSIEEVGERTVYDIGVEHHAHNFLANGFVVSNCGVRMVKTNLTYDDLRGKEEELVDALFKAIPSGLGKGGVVQTDMATVEEILMRGPAWAVEHGYGVERDLLTCEDEGQRPEADHTKVSDEAKQRGKNQVGSLGSGNHFLEVQRVTDIYNDVIADAYGLEPDQLVILIHCGSRGLGHQVCTDYLRKIERTHKDLLEQLPDRELAAAPAGSQLADDYYKAMCAAINFAWTNRHLIMVETRNVFEEVFGQDWEDLGMELLYDVAHNIAKREPHMVDGEERDLFVHRKGATRAFPAGREEIPRAYRDVGQPVLIPGSMGTGSYILCGGAESMELSFGSTAHGAGRVMSRTQAKKQYWGGDVQTELREQQHVYVKAQSGATVAEEAPGVYKDVDEVVRVSDELGIGTKVARTYPVVNIKG